MIKISIIIPCLNESAYIKTCIESIINADILYEQSEVIFVDGNSEDTTVKMIESYTKKYPFIKLLHNPQKYTAISMNIGIQASSGKYIFILSAHAKYDKSYFKQLKKELILLNADCVGAVLTTKVKNMNTKSLSIKEVLMHKFGVGNASFRTGTNEIKAVDTVAFGCYDKEVFNKYGYFDERLIRNQDIELNKRIINAGGKIYLIPYVNATYYARENFRDLAKNNYSNGLWNILTAYYTKSFNSLSLRHFIPLLFILSLVMPLVLSILIPQIILLGILSLSSYLALVIIISLKLKERNNSFHYVIISFLVLHTSYGLGSLIGIFVIIPKYFKGKK